MTMRITNQSNVRFRVFDGSMDVDILVNFCKRLIESSGRKNCLVLDNLRVHHIMVFKAWLEKHEDKIEVFDLSSYSPELSPDEYLNCNFKATCTEAFR